MPDRWTKKQRQELRELQGLAWERELSAVLEDPRKDFRSWRKGRISPFELNDRIHRFHNGRSRDLFNSYAGSLDEIWITRGIAHGILKETDVPADLLVELRADIEMFRERLKLVEDVCDEK